MPLTKKNNKRRSTSTPTPKTKVTPSKNEKKATTSAPSSKKQQHVESVVKVEQNVVKAKKAWTDDIDNGKIESKSSSSSSKSGKDDTTRPAKQTKLKKKFSCKS